MFQIVDGEDDPELTPGAAVDTVALENLDDTHPYSDFSNSSLPGNLKGDEVTAPHVDDGLIPVVNEHLKI